MANEDDVILDAKMRSKESGRKANVPRNHAEVESAEIVVIGSDATIHVNKASVQDFLTIYEQAFQKGQSLVLNQNAVSSDSGEKLSNENAVISSPQVASSIERNSVFISYSRHDERYLEELHAHLDFYERNKMMKFWDDTKIKPGAKWLEEIKKALRSAKVAVMLVSPEFLASDFIATTEVPPLLKAASQEGASILSVILRPSAFKHSELAQFQTVNPPSRPLSNMSRGERDEVWNRLAERIRDELKVLD